jgi:hypothetical protein
MLNPQDKATWKAFFAVADAFHELAPWQWMEDRHIFRVHSSRAGQDYYCSILGNGGEVFGLNMYPGEAGLASLLALYEGVNEGSEVPPLAIYDQECYRLDFTETMYLSEEDHALYAQLDRQLGTGDQLHVTLRHSRPGLVPTLPLADQVTIATEVIVEALEVAKNYENQVATLDQLADMNSLPARQLDADGQAVIEYLKMPEVELLWDTAPLPTLTARSIAQLPVKDQIDVLVVLHLPGQMVQEAPDQDAYFPLTLLWVNSTDGSIEGFDLAHPQEMKRDLLQRVATRFSEQGFRPNQLAVNDVLVAKAVEDFCKSLEITLLITPPELINELYMTMMQLSGQMEDPGPDGPLG